MKSHSVTEARANFTKLIDSALKGEPQRITRYDKDAVLIISESEWLALQPKQTAKPGFGELLAELVLLAQDGPIADRPWIERKLGVDFE